MAYFVSVSGTQPLRTNDVDLLLSATAKPGNGFSTLNKSSTHQNGPVPNGNRFNGNTANNPQLTGGGGTTNGMMNLSRKDSAMDIVNDAFQFLDNKSCISVNSNGGHHVHNGRGCCDCDEDDVLDDCHYSVTGDDENGGREDVGDGAIIDNANSNNHFAPSNGHSNHQNGNAHVNRNLATHQQQTSFHHHSQIAVFNGNHQGNNSSTHQNNRINSSRIQQQITLEEDVMTVSGNANGSGSGPFFQSELSARLTRRKESVDSDDTRCPSSNFSSGGAVCNTNNIPLLSSTLQSRAVPPPPPLPHNSYGPNCGDEEGDEVYVNSDDVIAQTLSRNYQHQSQYSRPQQPMQAPRLPPRPANFNYESCSAELIEKLQRRLSRIPDA